MKVIWSGRFGSAPVQVLVICKVAVRRLFHWLTRALLTPKVHCGGKGVNQKTRKEVLAQDLTRPGPLARRIFEFVRVCVSFFWFSCFFSCFELLLSLGFRVFVLFVCFLVFYVFSGDVFSTSVLLYSNRRFSGFNVSACICPCLKRF